MVIGKRNREERFMQKAVRAIMKGEDPISILERECDKCLSNCATCKLDNIINNLVAYIARLEVDINN